MVIDSLSIGGAGGNHKRLRLPLDASSSVARIRQIPRMTEPPRSTTDVDMLPIQVLAALITRNGLRSLRDHCTPSPVPKELAEPCQTSEPTDPPGTGHCRAPAHGRVRVYGIVSNRVRRRQRQVSD